MLNLEPLFTSLKESEKEILKYLIVLFPCYYLLYYLFYIPFLNLSIFTQCTITLATSTLVFFIFIGAEFIYSALASFVGLNRLTIEAFFKSIIAIIFIIILGFFFGFTTSTLIIACCIIIIIFIAQFIYSINNFVKKRR